MLPDRPPTGRPSRLFDAVLLTHGHMGHYAGLVHFGKEAANTSGVPVFASAAMIDFLTGNEPWAALFRHGNLVACPLQEGVEAVVGEGVSVTAHSVPHRADFTDTFAFEIEAGARSLLYLPDIDDWDAWPGADTVVERVDVAMLDATFFSGDEHPGRDLAAVPHPAVTATLERFGRFAASTRLVLTHLNWTNPLCDPASAESAAVRRAGFEVADDGLVVPL